MAAMTAKEAATAQPRDKDYKLSDEKGLYLLVKKTGGKYWRMKYRYLGKEKTLAIWCKARYSNFSTASSLGNDLLVLVT